MQVTTRQQAAYPLLQRPSPASMIVHLSAPGLSGLGCITSGLLAANEPCPGRYQDSPPWFGGCDGGRVSAIQHRQNRHPGSHAPHARRANHVPSTVQTAAQVVIRVNPLPLSPLPSPLSPFPDRPMTRDRASLFLSEGPKQMVGPSAGHAGVLPAPEAHTNALFFSCPAGAPQPYFQPLNQATPPGLGLSVRIFSSGTPTAGGPWEQGTRVDAALHLSHSHKQSIQPPTSNLQQPTTDFPISRGRVAAANSPRTCSCGPTAAATQPICILAPIP